MKSKTTQHRFGKIRPLSNYIDSELIQLVANRCGQSIN